MSQAFVFSSRWKWLAIVLSVLALWSALLAPAAALAQDLGEGRWFGVCSAAHAGESPHDASGEGHCGLCLLPGPALPPSAMSVPVGTSADAALSAGALRHWPVIAPVGPFIRGPPLVL